MEYASVNTTKDHFHDDFIFLKLPEFISFLLSHLMLVIPAQRAQIQSTNQNAEGFWVLNVLSP